VIFEIAEGRADFPTGIGPPDRQEPIEVALVEAQAIIAGQVLQRKAGFQLRQPRFDRCRHAPCS
jgi:hypothetical protein